MATPLRDVVVIKWGGGVITDKTRALTADVAVINSLAVVVARIIQTGLRVILVHGAGSFGHLRAKRWRLAEGRLPAGELPAAGEDEDGVCSQDEAFLLVQKEMMDLNALVCAALQREGVLTASIAPHTFVSSLGPKFTGVLPKIMLAGGGDDDSPTCRSRLCVTTWGDPVLDAFGQGFGILSGDDIVVRLCLEVPGVTRLVFAGAIDGILTRPPEDPEAELLPVWTPGVHFVAEQNVAIDVTGGIGLKADRAALVAAEANGRVRCFVVNGRHPDRVFAACTGQGAFVGTEITAAQTTQRQRL